MYKAMILKELHDIQRIAILALIAFLILATRQMAFEHLPWSSGSLGIPFINSDFIEWYLWCAAGFAIALGLVQSLGESIHGTYPFLWHRPASRRWLLGMKLAVGVMTYLICAAIPILIYALWAATPGTHPSPFQWSMTSEAWQIWFWMTLLYFSAFLSGIRPARWFGTRLLPLAAPGCIIFIFSVSDYYSLWGLITILIVNVIVLGSIFLVARQRDY